MKRASAHAVARQDAIVDLEHVEGTGQRQQVDDPGDHETADRRETAKGGGGSGKVERELIAWLFRQCPAPHCNKSEPAPGDDQMIDVLPGCCSSFCSTVTRSESRLRRHWRHS